MNEASGLQLGTSAFTAASWQGSFYPADMKPADYLSFYATNSTPSRSTQLFTDRLRFQLSGRGTRRHRPDLYLPQKLPQITTHEKVLVDCDIEYNEFIGAMDNLGEKLVSRAKTKSVESVSLVGAVGIEIAPPQNKP